MKTTTFVGPAILATLLAAQAIADPIPYPTPGVENPVIYSFTAAASGPIVAYFAGSTAAFHNELGLLVNGVDTGIYGLENHSSALGQSLSFGNVTAGDTLTFVLRIDSGSVAAGPLDGSLVYSDPSLNAAYDSVGNPGSAGHNHVYSTPYTGTGPIIDAIPVGTFVSFEDLPAAYSDWNYNDEDFVFTNVRSTPDAGSSLLLLALTFGLLGWFARCQRRACA